MALGTHEQFHSLLREKKHVLITTGTHASGDAIASASAIATFLSSINVRADIVIDGFEGDERFNFLREVKKIQSKFEYLKKFILNIDIAKTGVKELSYDTDGDTLRVYITPKHGEIEQKNITTSESLYRYDAIIVLDTDDLESLGKLYQKHAPLFFETPLINIAHTPSNEQYGNVNIVDITASSTAEVVYEILNSIGKENISEEIATALLTGMISKTNSFKEKDSTPKSLGIASKLMRFGADRDFIIDKLYRTRTISSLKLWGEALMHLQHDEKRKFVWTSLTREAFSRAGATERDLTDLVPELISSSPSAEVIAIFHEHPNDDKIHGIVYSNPRTDARTLVSAYEPTGTAKSAQFFVKGKPLKEVESLIVDHIKHSI